MDIAYSTATPDTVCKNIHSTDHPRCICVPVMTPHQAGLLFQHQRLPLDISPLTESCRKHDPVMDFRACVREVSQSALCSQRRYLLTPQRLAALPTQLGAP